MNNTFTFLIAFLMITTAVAQDKLCGTSEVINEAIKKNPKIQQVIDQQNDWAKKYALLHNNKKSSNNYVIPIVFHVMHNYGGENVSKAQIEDAVRIINEDFQKRNADSNQVISQFIGIADNAEIEFRLAQIDPNGNCTEGITRHHTNLTFNAGENVKSIISWNTSKYLNVWVVSNIESGAGAYAYYPGTAPSQSQEGIVCRASQLGSIGASGGSNFAARTLTHEIGHYFNLPHTWGSTNNNAVPNNCNFDDGIADTPNTIGSNQNCNLNQNTCNSLDNIQNYMDYASCSKMFTTGQKTRMHAALNNGAGNRNNLWTNSNLIATGTNDNFNPTVCAPIADFNTLVKYICVGDSITFTDLSYNAAIDPSWNWNWTCNGATPTTYNTQHPTMYFNTPGVFDVTLTVSNSGGSDTYTRTGLIHVGATTGGEIAPFVEGMESTTFPAHPSNSLKDWQIVSSTPSTWQKTNAAAATGNNSMRIYNRIIEDGSTNSIISPTIDFSNVTSTKGYIAFKTAYAKRDTNAADILKVWVSTNCGNTWTLRYAKGATDLVSNGGSFVSGPFIPNSNQWKQHVVNITWFAGESSLLVKFDMVSNNGNYLYLDDINIGATATSIQELIDMHNVQVYPNPATSNANLKYEVFESTVVKLSLRNVLGATISEQQFEISAGKHTSKIVDDNIKIAKGTYFLSVNLNNTTVIKKIIFN